VSKAVRLQLSRRAGFNLQAASQAANGLPAVNVARPTKWGNPFDFRKSDCCWIALSFGCRADRPGRQEASVRAFRAWIDPPDGKRTASLTLQVRLGNEQTSVAIGAEISAGAAPSLDDLRAALRGRNLACWCKAGDPCHADVLLEMANRRLCEEVTAEGHARDRGPGVVARPVRSEAEGDSVRTTR
jgi:hypothetical protein